LEVYINVNKLSGEQLRLNTDYSVCSDRHHRVNTIKELLGEQTSLPTHLHDVLFAHYSEY